MRWKIAIQSRTKQDSNRIYQYIFSATISKGHKNLMIFIYKSISNHSYNYKINIDAFVFDKARNQKISLKKENKNMR